MTQIFPSQRIAKKFKTKQSGDNNTLNDTVTVGTSDYGVIYKLWVDVDVINEADLKNASSKLDVMVTIGSLIWKVAIHLYILHTVTQNTFYSDLGPWAFDFGDDGLYSGVLGDDIVIDVAAAGSGIKARVNYTYSGD